MIWEATGEKNTVSLEAETTGAVLDIQHPTDDPAIPEGSGPASYQLTGTI